MGFRFRRSVKLFPGVRLNLTARGISATVGVRGASVNIGPTGTHLNVGLPGTGLSYRTRLDQPNRGRGGRRRPNDETPEDHFPPLSPEDVDDLTHNDPLPEVEPVRQAQPIAPTPQPDEDLALNTPIIPSADQSGPEVSFSSAGADNLTSPGLRSLSTLLVRISNERARVSSVIQERSASLPSVHAKGDRAHGIPARLLVNRRRRHEVEAAAKEYEKQLVDMRALLDGLAMDADFALADESKDAFLDLTRAFEKMKASERIWDVSARRGDDPGRTKAMPASSVSRAPVTLDVANFPEIDSDYEALHFQNANGADLYLYPYFLAIPRPDGGFALMDLREITATAQNRTLIETESVPHDALVVGYSWAQSNKDGSRDQRFKGNRQIPNCYYSELELRSPSGLNEVYQFSNAHVASAFAKTLGVFVSTLPARELGVGDMGLTGPSIPTVNPPDPPNVPSLMTGSVFVRLIVLAAIVAGAVWLNNPEGRSRSGALWSLGKEMANRVIAKVQSHSSEIAATAPDSPAASLVPAPPVKLSVPPAQTKPAGAPTSPVQAQPAAPAAASPQIQSAAPPVSPTLPKSTVATSTLAVPLPPAVDVVMPPASVMEPQAQSAPVTPTPVPTVAPAISTKIASQLTSDQTVKLQQKLIELGYQEGEPDGRTTARVIAAFNRWRSETGRAPVQAIGSAEYETFIRAISR